ncbi:MAG TPA: hypothetical protein VHO24_07070 [Opitutaceae bacterium]|nr:hypothetical protein [Opitutaceae bacterium]
MAMDEFDESPPASRPKLSKTPSWIMLGFVLGALFVLAMNKRPGGAATATPPPAPPPKVATPPVTSLPPRLTDIEAYFGEWRKYAFWDDDLSYVVAFDPPSGTYRDAFEILRVGEKYYFRSITRPRGMRVREGVPHNSLFQFLVPIPEEPRGIFGAPAAAPPATGGTP